MKLNLHSISESAAPMVWLLAGMLMLSPVGVHAQSGFILCADGDGRIEIESAHSGDCAARLSLSTREMHTGFVVMDASAFTIADCNPSCIDILFHSSPFDGQAALSSAKTPSLKIRLLSDVPVFSASIVLESAVAWTEAAIARSRSGSPGLLSSLAPTRSVVLLI